MGGGESKHTVEYRTDPKMAELLDKQGKMIDSMMKEIAVMNKQNQKQQERFLEMISQLKDDRNALENVPPEQFASKVREITDKFINNLRTLDLSIVPLKKRDGRAHICFAGPTSCGKSTGLNALFGTKVAETGLGETTLTISPVGVHNDGFSVYDMPGNNNRISYMEFSTICFVKSMTLVVIVFDNDPAAVMDLIKVCDSLRVPFVALRNKIDSAYEECDDDDPAAWKAIDEQKIRGYIDNKELLKAVYQISARNVFLNKTKGSSRPTYDWDEFTQTINTL